MTRNLFAIGLAATAALGACGKSENSAPTKPIEVRSAEQDRMHELGAFDLAIALKHAIYDLGYTCPRITKAGFVGKYKNLDMWTATCSDKRDWAIFAGPDGSVQARDCKDLEGTDLPKCVITKAPEGSFDSVEGASADGNAAG